MIILKWGQGWKRVIMKHLENTDEVIPFELAKEFEGINGDRIAYILRIHGWKKHTPPMRSSHKRLIHHVRYTRR